MEGRQFPLANDQGKRAIFLDDHAAVGLSLCQGPIGAVSAEKTVVGSVPGCMRQGIQGNLEIAFPADFGLGKPAPVDVDLKGVQDQLWHRQGLVALVPEANEVILALAGDEMGVCRPLFGHRTHPAWLAATRLVVMPDKGAGDIW